jgi:hypothetical protein
MPAATGSVYAAAFEEIHMKRFFGFALILALFSIPALASKSETVTLPGTVKVGSTQLPAGDYKASWTGTGSSVQVTLTRNGKTVVTVPAKLVEEKHNLNGVTTNTQGGVDFLQTIQLNHVSLVLENAPTTGQ